MVIGAAAYAAAQQMFDRTPLPAAVVSVADEGLELPLPWAQAGTGSGANARISRSSNSRSPSIRTPSCFPSTIRW